jgi:hypothetical protein
MTMSADCDFILRVLRVASEYDLFGDLFWHMRGQSAPVAFCINCNDLFEWACADAEEVTPENIAELEKACAECLAAGDKGCIYGGSLFCCRVRKMRPQGAAYPRNAAVWPLFDACGPERPTDFNNPKRQPAAVSL